MRHYIEDDTYYIVDNEEKVLLKIRIVDFPEYQVVMETEREVYAGPIKFLKFTDDTPPK